MSISPSLKRDIDSVLGTLANLGMLVASLAVVGYVLDRLLGGAR